jgi:hypothetical protein
VAIHQPQPGESWGTRATVRASDAAALSQLRSFSRIDISEIRRSANSNKLAVATPTKSSGRHDLKFLLRQVQEKEGRASMIRMGCVPSVKQIRNAVRLRHASQLGRCEDMARERRAADKGKRGDIRFLPIAVATWIFLILHLIFLCYWLH